MPGWPPSGAHSRSFIRLNLDLDLNLVLDLDLDLNVDEKFLLVEGLRSWDR